ARPRRGRSRDHRRVGHRRPRHRRPGDAGARLRRTRDRRRAVAAVHRGRGDGRVRLRPRAPGGPRRLARGRGRPRAARRGGRRGPRGLPRVPARAVSGRDRGAARSARLRARPLARGGGVSSQAPTFSVVMPAHNTASMIGDAIASVLAQTRTDFELLVVDDRSTDGTPDVVRRFADDPRVELLPSGPERGPGAARNAAIARARGRYVSMLDSDDLWLPTYLEAVGAALDRHASAGLACTLRWTLDDPPGLLRRSVRPARAEPEVLAAAAFLARLAQRNFVVNSTVTLRRSLAVELGGCNSALRAAVDFDLWLRTAAAGYGAVFLQEPLAVYRVRR